MKNILLKQTAALLLVVVLTASNVTPVLADEPTVSPFTLEEFSAMMADYVYMSEDEEKIYMGDDGWIYKISNGTGNAFPYQQNKFTYDAAAGLCKASHGWVFKIENGKITEIYYQTSPDYIYSAYNKLSPEELTSRIADKYEGTYKNKNYTLTKTADTLIISNGSSSETLNLSDWQILETDDCLMMGTYSTGYTVKFVVSDGVIRDIFKETFMGTEWDVYAVYSVSVPETANGTVSAVPEEANEGETVTLTVTPEEGYELSELVVTDSSGAAVTVTDNKFTMPAGNITVSAAFTASTAAIGGQCGDHATWTLANGTLTISGSGDMYDMTDHDAVSVAGKTPWDAYRSEIKKVIIENGITGIGRYAFFKCTALKEVEIPNSVTFMGRHAFHGCSSLPSITIPGSLAKFEEDVFARCSSLETAVIEEGVQTLSVGMFDYDNALVNVSLPSTLTSIASSAFFSCKGLKQITIPDNVSAIYGGAFEYCSSLESAVIPEGVTEMDISFSHCTSLKSLTIPSTVTKFNRYALSGCTALESLTIPEGTTTIHDYAFINCKSLKTVSIPGSVTYLGDCAFSDCTSLNTVHIADGTCKIGKNAFINCTAVTDVYIHATDYKNYTFDTEAAVDDFKTPSGTTLHIPVTVDPASLTPETGGAIYYWYQANNASVVNDIADDIAYPVTINQADGGTLTSDRESAAAGDTVVLTPAPDSVHTLRTITINNGLVEVTFNADGTCSFIMPAGNVTVSVSWRSIYPEFMTCSLLLSGEIGVNFFLDLPEIDGVDYSTSYMEFTVSGINGRTTQVPYNKNQMNSAKTFYGFTCRVNSLQMADTITAVFHYFKNGTEQTITTSYTVEDYLMHAFGTASEKLFNLILALNSYGYHAQNYFSAKNGWTLGTDHTAMGKIYVYEYDSEELEEAKNAVSTANVTAALNADISSATFSLIMDSETSINVYCKPAEGYNGIFTAEADGAALNVNKQSDGRYLITIPNIGAHKLGKNYTVTIRTASGTSTITLSALSYAKSWLSYSAADEKMVNLMTALYYYYKAAADYIA